MREETWKRQEVTLKTKITKARNLAKLNVPLFLKIKRLEVVKEFEEKLRQHRLNKHDLVGK